MGIIEAITPARVARLEIKTMKIFIVLFSAVLLAIPAGTVAGAHGDHGRDGHHRNGGNTGIHDCYLGTGFQDYSSVISDDSNIMYPHHGNGSVVNAALPSGASFVGGFCVKSSVQSSEDILRVNLGRLDNVTEFDTIWLKSNDGNYYPTDWTPGDATVDIAEAGWADNDAQPNAVEAEVLFSRSAFGSGNLSHGSGGGCNSIGESLAWLGAIPSLSLVLSKKR
ncbi:MAG: hypothetical protein LBE65_03820 [Synergistaceae bacterium]|jgi:hypothetical protein|nr:hypothetical protein [Synergistaceae bacterium]